LRLRSIVTPHHYNPVCCHLLQKVIKDREQHYQDLPIEELAQDIYYE